MPTYTSTTYIVFLDLPHELAESIDTLRGRYNPAAVKRWSPHITLKQDEDYACHGKDLSALCERSLRGVFPLEVKCKDVIAKGGPGGMLYLGVDSIQLVEMVKRLSISMESYIAMLTADAGKSTRWEQSDGFFPHITIAPKSNDQSLTEARQLLAPWVGKVVQIQSASLCRWDTDHWSLVKRFM